MACVCSGPLISRVTSGRDHQGPGRVPARATSRVFTLRLRMERSDQTPIRTEATPAEKHLSQRLLMEAAPDAHLWQACAGGP
jgi:hypothetical protein